ncbi:MAG TPA: peptidylprolyl isomerase [Vicinamibacterales bacterium]|jgi:cyclophilin family peptidyl-prolyl cis-trans isomerase
MRVPILLVLCGLCGPTLAAAQNDPPPSPRVSRLAVLQAEDRRAPTPHDLSVIRSGAHSGDPQTVRIAIRALGRLERPSLIPDITFALRNALPEIRSEAADAIAQAAQGWKHESSAPASVRDTARDAAFAALATRLKVEADPDVRAAICESIGRLPYATAAQAETAERALLEAAENEVNVSGRLGVAKGLEAFVRIQRKLRPPSEDAVTRLRRLSELVPREAATGARVRRLAMEALITAAAVDDDVLQRAAADPDAQVRRIAMHAAAAGGNGVTADLAHRVLASGLKDDSPSVRLEALRNVRARNDPDACSASLTATRDRDTNVALSGFDQLGACAPTPTAVPSSAAAPSAVASAGGAQDGNAGPAAAPVDSPAADDSVVTALEQAVADAQAASVPRGWHRAAHALVALASVAPERASAALPSFTASGVWQLRMYAARAAAQLGNRAALEQLARDDDDNVREAAVEGLRKIAGHDADAVYLAQLTRPGNQILRAAALALGDTPHPELAIPALKAEWDRLVAAGRDNSHDARDAIARTLTALGAPPHKMPAQAQASDLNAEDLRRLASARARVTIRGLGTFELALVTAQASATVLRFARLAEAGYYNGLTFHRVVPNFVIQGGSPGASEYIGDSPFMRDEVGLWPHVRGSVGISTRGRDTGDAQIFVDLVDNPRLDHEYTVFAQVLNGIGIIDQVLEGDVIERVEIVPGP